MSFNVEHYKKNGTPAAEVRITQQQYVALGGIALIVGVVLINLDASNSAVMLIETSEFQPETET